MMLFDHPDEFLRRKLELLESAAKKKFPIGKKFKRSRRYFGKMDN